MALVLSGVTKNFGGLRAVGDVSFSVPEDVIFGLIGPNGAGKTTVFNLITGVYKPDVGSISFGEVDLRPLKPAQIAGAGIGRTFQNIRLFGQLTVIENLLVACELQKKAHLASAILRLPAHYEDEEAMYDRALELLRVFELHEMAEDAPTSLSYGNQRRLEIARAMMLKPKLLLLDEPAAGMNYGEAEGLKTQIRWLRDTFKLSVVLVEHNMQVVMGVCEDIHVLDHGETIAHGPPDQVRKDPKVLAAYLGEEEESAESVRAAVEEASKPDVAKLAPPSSPTVDERAADSLESPKKLSEPELDDLARQLAQSMERGLPKPEDEPLPVAEPALPVTPSEPRLNNIDRGWSSDKLKAEPAVAESAASPAAPIAPDSVPNVSKLDQGWGSDKSLPVSDDDKKDEL